MWEWRSQIILWKIIEIFHAIFGANLRKFLALEESRMICFVLLLFHDCFGRHFVTNSRTMQSCRNLRKQGRIYEYTNTQCLLWTRNVFRPNLYLTSGIKRFSIAVTTKALCKIIFPLCEFPLLGEVLAELSSGRLWCWRPKRSEVTFSPFLLLRQARWESPRPCCSSGNSVGLWYRHSSGQANRGSDDILDYRFRFCQVGWEGAGGFAPCAYVPGRKGWDTSIKIKYNFE